MEYNRSSQHGRNNINYKTMRIYKIINTDKITAAKDFLVECDKQTEANYETIRNEITPFEWESWFGYSSGFSLLPRFTGFKPEPPLKEVPKGWKPYKDEPSVLVPNGRTKIGREAAKKLRNLPNWHYPKIYQVLSIKEQDHVGRFTIPELRITEDKSEVFLITDDRVKLDKADFEEVTQTYVEEKLGIN